MPHIQMKKNVCFSIFKLLCSVCKCVDLVLCMYLLGYNSSCVLPVLPRGSHICARLAWKNNGVSRVLKALCWCHRFMKIAEAQSGPLTWQMILFVTTCMEFSRGECFFEVCFIKLVVFFLNSQQKFKNEPAASVVCPDLSTSQDNRAVKSWQ